MYPFNTENSIVKNRWYIAAFSNEISREPMGRTLLGLPVVMYRKLDGKPVAMYGLCPHRYFPLAKSKLEGDAIKCGYHGFTFDHDGKCIDVPSQTARIGFCQPSYRLEERGPICWIWMGDEDKCDLALIPPYEDFGLDQPDWHYSSENYFHLKGRYQLLVDNLMDLTHLPYVHFHIPGGEAMKKTVMKEETRDHGYRLDRYGKVPFTPFHEHMFGKDAKFEGLSDFISRTDFYGPEFIRTSMPITTAIEGDKEVPAGLGALFILHGITPETETTTHYFGFSTRNFRIGDKALDDFQLQSDCKIRLQDVDAIEAVEDRLSQAAEFQKELLVKSDAPAVKVRRMVQAMLDLEAV